MSPTLRELAV